jgi:hypothetical protein
VLWVTQVGLVDLILLGPAKFSLPPANHGRHPANPLNPFVPPLPAAATPWPPRRCPAAIRSENEPNGNA